MKNKKKEAKFFCESCGSEVPRNSKTCPQCGKFFASVRCPQCGRTGSNEDFINGCPTCGYAVNPDPDYRRSAFSPVISGNKRNKYNSFFNRKKALADFSIFTKRKISGYSPDSGLPVWVYVVTVVVLVFLVLYLYSCL